MFICRRAGGCLSRVNASIHLNAEDAELLLNGCRTSPWAACKLLLICCQAASRLLLETCCRVGGRPLPKLSGFQKYIFSGLVRAPFWLRFWPRFRARDLRPTCGLSSMCPLGNLIFCQKKGAIWLQKIVATTLSLDVNQNPIDLLPKYSKTYMNHAFTSFFEPPQKKNKHKSTCDTLNIGIRCVF